MGDQLGEGSGQGMGWGGGIGGRESRPEGSSGGGVVLVPKKNGGFERIKIYENII